MLSAAFTGGIIAHFEDALAAQVALTAFIPMLRIPAATAAASPR